MYGPGQPLLGKLPLGRGCGKRLGAISLFLQCSELARLQESFKMHLTVLGKKLEALRSFGLD